MAPRNVSRETGVGDCQRQESVAGKGFRARRFAGIDVWASRKACGVNEERRPCVSEKLKEQIETGVIDLLARDGAVRPLAPEKFLLEGLPEVSRRAKKNDHGRFADGSA